MELEAAVARFRTRFFNFHLAYTGLIVVAGGALADRYFGFRLNLSDPKDAMEKIGAAFTPVYFFFKLVWPKITDEKLKRKFRVRYEELVQSLVEFTSFDESRRISYLLHSSAQPGPEFRKRGHFDCDR